MIRRLLIVLAIALAAPPAAAESATRVLVFSRLTQDGRDLTGSGLETAIVTALQDERVRLLDQRASLREKRYELSDQVAAGSVPREVSALDADVVVSVQLRCSEVSGGILDTSVRAEACSLDTKVVRIAGGEVVFAANEQLTGHGLTAETAVQSLLRKRVPATLREQREAWLTRLLQRDRKLIELSVSNIGDSGQAHELRDQLARLPGVAAVELIGYETGLAKFHVSGASRTLADTLSRGAELPLNVTFEAGETLYAELDLARIYRQRMIVLLKASEGGGESEALQAALLNLPYLEMAHSVPLTHVTQQTQTLHAPLTLTVRVTQTAAGVVCSLSLSRSSDQRVLLTADSQAARSGDAIDAAVHALDTRFRAALRKPEQRKQLGVADKAERLASAAPLSIVGFNPPSSVQLRNHSALPIEGATLSVRGAQRTLFTSQLARIEPGSSLRVPLQLAPPDEPSLRLSASIAYRAGGIPERSQAYAQWVIAAAASAPANPEHADLSAQAERLHRRGQWAQARALYLRLYELQPRAQVLMQLGKVELDLGNVESAQRYLTEAVSPHAPSPLLGEQLSLAHELLLVATRRAVPSGGT